MIGLYTDPNKFFVNKPSKKYFKVLFLKESALTFAILTFIKLFKLDHLKFKISSYEDTKTSLWLKLKLKRSFVFK